MPVRKPMTLKIAIWPPLNSPGLPRACMAVDQVSFSTPSWRAPSDTLMISPETRPPRMILFQFMLPPN